MCVFARFLFLNLEDSFWQALNTRSKILSEFLLVFTNEEEAFRFLVREELVVPSIRASTSVSSFFGALTSKLPKFLCKSCMPAESAV